MKNSLMKSFVTISMIALINLGFATTSYAQTANKKSDHKKDVMQADAYALAYINCKYDLAKYNSEALPSDQRLKNQMASIEKVKRKINLNSVKYGKDVDLYAQFSKLIEGAKTDLPTCIKYQNTLTALDVLDKTKK